MDNNNQKPEPPKMSKNDFNEADAKNLKNVQTLFVVSSFAGPVSLIIGGVLLGTAGLVCGILALRKASELVAKGGAVGSVADRLKKSSIIAIVICGIAIVINAVYVFLTLPVLMEALQSGNYSNFMSGSGSGGGSGSGSSAWG